MGSYNQCTNEGYFVDKLLIEQLQRIIPDSPQQFQGANNVVLKTMEYIRYLEEFEKVVRDNPQVYVQTCTVSQPSDQSFEESRFDHMTSCKHKAPEGSFVRAKTKKVDFNVDDCFGDPGAHGDNEWFQTRRCSEPSSSSWPDQLQNFESYTKGLVGENSLFYGNNNSNNNNNTSNETMPESKIYRFSPSAEKPKIAYTMLLTEKERQSCSQKHTNNKRYKIMQKPALRHNLSKKAESKGNYQRLSVSPKPEENPRRFCKVTVPTCDSIIKNESLKTKESSKNWIFKNYKSYLKPKKCFLDHEKK